MNRIRFSIVARFLVAAIVAIFYGCAPDEMLTEHFVTIEKLPTKGITLGILERYKYPISVSDTALSSRDRERIGLYRGMLCMVFQGNGQCDTMPLRMRSFPDDTENWPISGYDTVESRMIPFSKNEVIVVLESTHSAMLKSGKRQSVRKQRYMWVVDLLSCKELFFRRLRLFVATKRGSQDNITEFQCEVFMRNDTIFEVFPRNGWKQGYAYVRSEDRYVRVDSFLLDQAPMRGDLFFQL